MYCTIFLRFGCEMNCGIHLIFTLLDLVEPKIENVDIIKNALSTDALHDCHQVIIYISD